MENEVLYNLKGEVPEEEYTIPLGLADVKRAGRDVTIVAWSRSVQVALHAARRWRRTGRGRGRGPPHAAAARRGRDLRLGAPDEPLLVVEEGWRYAGFGAEIADRVQRECFDSLDAPVLRVTSADVPMPYSRMLEKVYLPQPEKVVDAVKQVLYR